MVGVELGDVHLDPLGKVVGIALDLNLVTRIFEDTALADADGHSDEVEGDAGMKHAPGDDL
jgi:hypothetical protein